MNIEEFTKEVEQRGLICPPTKLIKATTLPEAWIKAVDYVLSNGMLIGTQYGNRSVDAHVTISISNPYAVPMLHKQFPTKELHLKEYLKQWEREYGFSTWAIQGFEYSYMNRALAYPAADFKEGTPNEHYYMHASQPFLLGPDSLDSDRFINQIDRARDLLSKGISRRVQIITWLPDRDLFVEGDQPCFQRLWLRNLGNGYLEAETDWRSRDCFAAWNSNVAGMLYMIKREFLEPLNLKLAKYDDHSNSLHIYEGNWDEALHIDKPVRDISRYTQEDD
jgi:thymidylate synthase